MGLSNEVLFIHVAQGAAKLPEVKVGDTKKNAGGSCCLLSAVVLFTFDSTEFECHTTYRVGSIGCASQKKGLGAL